jgi:hypothetical protein
MRVQAKPVPSGTAIKLREDLLAEAGSWLLISDNDTVIVLSDVAFNTLYQIGSQTPPPPPPPKLRKHRELGRDRYRLVNQATLPKEGRPAKCGGQVVRVLCAIAAAAYVHDRRDVMYTEIQKHLKHQADDHSLSSRIGDLQFNKFVSKIPNGVRIEDAAYPIIEKFGDIAHTSIGLTNPYTKKTGYEKAKA